jgi:hypothetical protein
VKDIRHITISISDLAGESEFFTGFLHHLESLCIVDSSSSHEYLYFLLLHRFIPFFESIDNPSKCFIDMSKICDSSRDDEILSWYFILKHDIKEREGICLCIFSIRISAALTIVSYFFSMSHIRYSIRDNHTGSSPTGKKPDTPIWIQNPQF